MNELTEALRLAYLALLEAGCYAEEKGDSDHESYFDGAATHARTALENAGVLTKKAPK